MSFKGLIVLKSFLSKPEKARYNQIKKTRVDDPLGDDWDDHFFEIVTSDPQIGPITQSQTDQGSTDNSSQEPIPNKIKDLGDSKNLYFFSKSPGGLSGVVKSSLSSQSNEIKDFSAEIPPAVSSEPSAENNGEQRTNSEFSDVILPASAPSDEIIAAISGAHGCETDISFSCPFFRRRYCAAHTLGGGGKPWSFACDYHCPPTDMLVALAENNPAFAELLRKYGIRKGPAVGEGIVDGGIPFFITQAMRAELRARGYIDSEIDQLKPAAAHEILRGEGGKL